MQTTIGELPLIRRGKVRDVYDMGDALLIVATDRISCFDVVLPTPIPGKGAILTRMSEMWFGLTRDIVRNHFRSAEVPAAVTDEKDRSQLQGRVMVVDKAEALPVEAIVRETSAKYREALRLLAQPNDSDETEIPGPESAR